MTFKFAILCSSDFDSVAKKMAEGSIEKLKAENYNYEVYHLPSILALLPALNMIINTDQFDGYIVLLANQEKHSEVLTALLKLGSKAYCLGITMLNSDTEKSLLDMASNEKYDRATLSALHLISLHEKLNNVRKGIGFKPVSEHIVVADHDNGTKST